MRKLIQNIVAHLPGRSQIWALASIEYFTIAVAEIRHWLAQRRYEPSKIIEKYCQFNQRQVNNNRSQQFNVLLIDCFPAPQWIIANSIFLNGLGDKYNASIASYGTLPRAPSMDAIYRSFGAEKHLRLNLSRTQRKRRNALYQSIMASLETPEDLFNLHIDGVWIGLDIYESILRIGIPTIDMEAYHTKHSIYHGLQYFVFFYDLIQSGRVKAVAPSHDSYIQMGTIVKIAQAFKVPVFYANPFEINRSCKNHDLSARFMEYPKYFASLPQPEKETAIAAAKQALAQRLGGAVGGDMKHQTKSAFTPDAIAPQTSNNGKLKVIVATHCFYDNPHAYSKMTFRDFYEWLMFLGEFSSRCDYEWYIKPHRDFLPGTMEVLNEFAAKYPKFKVIDPQTTFHQLKEEGVSIALTCYGSIGHELPLLGYQVINASYNPHSAYKFNTHCGSREEYEQILLRLDDLPPVEDVDRIYEFYAVQHFLTKSDKLLFDSFSDFEEFVDGDLLGEKCYEFFMRHPDRYATRYRRRVDAFLEAGCHYEFELRLPNWTAQAYQYDSTKSLGETKQPNRKTH